MRDSLSIPQVLPKYVFVHVFEIQIICCFADCDNLSGKIDIIICLGGDGTLLYASSLFQVRGANAVTWKFARYVECVLKLICMKAILYLAE